MSVEFVPGEKYRNRRGEYELLEITGDGRLKVRYLTDGQEVELDREQQARIIANMLLEQQTQERQAAMPPKPAPRSSSSTATSTRSTSTRSATSSPTPRAVAATSRSSTSRSSSRSSESAAPSWQPLVPVRSDFTKLEVLKLAQFIGYGNLDGALWFIGSSEPGPENGNIAISERVALPDYQKEFVDAKIIKERFPSQSLVSWRLANYLATKLLTPEEMQTESTQEYYSNRFGTLDGDVLLSYVLPLPNSSSTSVANWPYRNTTITDSPFYRDVLRDPRRSQEDEILGRDIRVKRLNELYNVLRLEEKTPRYVFCYGGASYWRYYREIFPLIKTYTELEIPYDTSKDRAAKAAIGQDTRTGTLVILTPNLSPSEGVSYTYLDNLLTILQGMRR